MPLSKKNPFEPPKPPAGDGVDVHVGVVIASTNPARVGTLDVDVYDVLPPAFDEHAHLGTMAPERDARGNVQCGRCATFVPYSTMSLSEDGAFCDPCADALIAEAQDS